MTSSVRNHFFLQNNDQKKVVFKTFFPSTSPNFLDIIITIENFFVPVSVRRNQSDDPSFPGICCKKIFFSGAVKKVFPAAHYFHFPAKLKKAIYPPSKIVERFGSVR